MYSISVKNNVFVSDRLCPAKGICFSGHKQKLKVPATSLFSRSWCLGYQYTLKGHQTVIISISVPDWYQGVNHIRWLLIAHRRPCCLSSGRKPSGI